MIDWRINQMILEGAGTAEEFDHAKKHILSALVRLSNRQRAERLAIVDSEGNLLNNPKTAPQTWIVQKKGTPFFRHYNEVQNLNDRFVVDFIDHAMVGENEDFVRVINQVVSRVSCCFLYFSSFF